MALPRTEVSIDATPTLMQALPADGRTLAVVLNSSAGALLEGGGSEKSLRHLFQAAGLSPVFIAPDAGTLPERIRLAAETGAAVVVAAGGDGTVACAAQALAGTATALGILPFGTMNLLAKDLGIPVGDLEAAVGVLAQAVVREIDVAEVNGKVFLCASMLGLPARLARHREGGRGGPAAALWSRMAQASWRALGRDPSLRIAMRTEEETRRLRASSITVAANALDDDSRPFGRSRLDAGQLAVYVTRRLHVGDVLRLLVRMVLRSWRQDSAIETRLTRRLVIAAPRRALRVMNDGEVMLLRPPLRYRIRARALRVLAPASSAPASSAPASSAPASSAPASSAPASSAPAA